MASKRELEDILLHLAPAVRDVLWCAIVWNDHNFSDEVIRQKCKSVADALGFVRGDVDTVNEWMARVDAALAKRYESREEHAASPLADRPPSGK